MSPSSLLWVCRDREVRLERTFIMGVLNVTPDSFSDGGAYADPDRAIARGLALEAEGADILDIGGESTRPGAAPVAEEEELRRVMPVLTALAQRTRCLLSVDTRHAAVARAALAAGAHIINDVSAATRDPAMAAVAVEYRAGLVLMHSRGEPATMQLQPHYTAVVEEVRAYLADRLAALETAGLPSQYLVVDPGIGFGKTLDHNLALLRALPRLAALGRPVLVGVSRKALLGRLTGRERPADRLAGSLAALTAAILGGARIVRVHDVAASRDAARVADALQPVST